MLKDLLQNSDGKYSTTGTIQCIGGAVLALILLYSTYLNRTYTPELYVTFALFCGGGVATKGLVTALKRGDGNDK